jgi:hypothetical protein
VILLASLILGAAIAWAAQQVVAELRAAREERTRARMLALLELFGPARAAVQHDPRAYLVWQPIAAVARQVCPLETATLDRAAGGAFPFTPADLQAAHAQWTTDWLAWERSHDAEYKLKAAAAAAELAAAATPGVARARLEAVENEKLDRYQRRYAEYVRIAKALQALQP